MKKNICFIIEYAYPLFKSTKGPFGGAEVDLYYLAKYFAQRDGFSCSFLLGDFGQPAKETIDQVKIIRSKYLNPIDFTKIHHKILRRIFFMWNVLTIDTDVFFLESSGEFALYVTWAAKLRNRKVIYRTAHDNDCQKTLLNNPGFAARSFHRAIGMFDLIISQNKDQQKMWMELENKPSVVVGNGHPIAPLPKDLKKDYALWVARAEDWKRPELFLDLAERIPDMSFVMVLFGENDVAKKINTRAKSIPNIKVVDYVSFFEIQDVYNNAKCFVNTSTHEGFPNAFLQACLGATPILSFNVNPDNFIGSNDLGHYCEEDMNSAVHFLSNLDTTNILRMGENARNYVRSKHNLEDKIDSYDKLIHQLFTPIQV